MNLFVSRPTPTAYFGAVMGIVGLGLAWRTAATAQHLPYEIGEWLIGLGSIVFVVLLARWLVRIAQFPQEFRAENNSAISGSYYGTLAIAISELAAAALPYSRPLALVLWVIAAVGCAVLLLYVLGLWIQRGISAAELTPALFIPVVGNATTLYAGVPLGMGDFSWMLFSFALVCWLTIGPLTIYRLLVSEPRLPRKMAPQLAVLVSSPAVLSNAWFLLDGGVADAVFKVLAFKALFFAVLCVRLWRMAWGEPFHAGMWGWTFPAAALAGSFEHAGGSAASAFYTTLASLTLALATLIVLASIAGTVNGWVQELRAAATQTG